MRVRRLTELDASFGYGHAASRTKLQTCSEISLLSDIPPQCQRMTAWRREISANIYERFFARGPSPLV